MQSYGALIGVRDETIEVISENAPALLAVGEPLGAPIGRVLGAEQMALVEELAGAETGETAILPVEVGPRRFDVTVHRSDGLLVLEFEPARSARLGSFTGFYAPIRQALVRMQRAGSVREACRAAVREVRAITGYDRVVAYRFESADGPGEVVAEDVTGDWEPWLGLWFPATDIPPQARRLYEANWIRVHGADLDPAALDTLLSSLPPLAAGEIWHSDRLGEDLPALAPHSGALDGALVLRSGPPATGSPGCGASGPCSGAGRPIRSGRRCWARTGSG